MSRNPALNKPLSSQLLYTYKSLKELRSEGDLNRLLCNAYFKDKGINMYDINSEERRAHDSILENCINEAYRICAQFFADQHPCEDVEYQYYLENKGIFSDIKDYQITISFVIILLIGYNEYSKEKIKSEHTALMIDGFVKELRDILLNCGVDYEYINSNKYDNKFLERPDIFRFVDLKPHPTSVHKLLKIIDNDTLRDVTKEYDQDTIIRIIDRYESKEEKITLLNVIHNTFLGKTQPQYEFADPRIEIQY